MAAGYMPRLQEIRESYSHSAVRAPRQAVADGIDTSFVQVVAHRCQRQGFRRIALCYPQQHKSLRRQFDDLAVVTGLQYVFRKRGPHQSGIRKEAFRLAANHRLHAPA